VVDLASREVVGWAVAAHMRAELVCDVMAIANRQSQLFRSEGRWIVGQLRPVFSPAFRGAVEYAPHRPHEVDVASFALCVRDVEQLAGPHTGGGSVRRGGRTR
jgi:transposase InsO family protein